jgi:MFS family permease
MFYRPVDPRTLRLLYLEIFWSSILAGALAFNGAYVVRLGATNADISLLSALPALSAIFISLPAGRFIQSRTHPGWWTLASLALHWTGFLLLAFVPWANLPGLPHGRLAVLLLVVFAMPAHVFGVGIHGIMAEVIPEHHRIRVYSMRSLINSIVLSATTLLAGLWLSRTAFPSNYQVLYVLGWVCAMICVGHWAPIIKANQAARQAARQAAPPPPPAAPAPKRRAWRPWPADVGQHPDFTRILRNSVLHSLGLWLAGPLYILRYVRELEASDAWLGALTTATGLSAIVGLLFWRWAAERLRAPGTLRLTIVGGALFPLLVGLTPSLGLILAFAALNGFFTAGINLSHINVLLPTLPEDRRPEYMGLYSTVMNVGAFVCPLLGVAVAGWLGLGPALALCGALALLGALSYWLWRVPARPVRALPAPQPDSQLA